MVEVMQERAHLGPTRSITAPCAAADQLGYGMNWRWHCAFGCCARVIDRATSIALRTKQELRISAPTLLPSPPVARDLSR